MNPFESKTQYSATASGALERIPYGAPLFYKVTAPSGLELIAYQTYGRISHTIHIPVIHDQFPAVADKNAGILDHDIKSAKKMFEELGVRASEHLSDQPDGSPDYSGGGSANSERTTRWELVLSLKHKYFDSPEELTSAFEKLGWNFQRISEAEATAK